MRVNVFRRTRQMSIQTHIDNIKAVAGDLRNKTQSSEEAADKVIADTIAFLEDLKAKNSELFKKKPKGSASTYAELLRNSEAISEDKLAYKLGNLKGLLEDLKDEQTGGRRRRTRRRKRTGKVTKTR